MFLVWTTSEGHSRGIMEASKVYKVSVFDKHTTVEKTIVCIFVEKVAEFLQNYYGILLSADEVAVNQPKIGCYFLHSFQ